MEPYELLEEKYGEFCNNPLTVVCSSGTAALHLAFETLRKTEDWEDDTTVAIPDFSMIACSRGVKLARLQPIPIEVDSLGLLEHQATLKANTDAVLSVHTYGRKCGFADGVDVGDSRTIVHDLSEAHGIQIRPSEVGCWSFYKNKVVAGEEGGIVAFATEEQRDVAKQLRNLGMSKDHDFNHIANGMNYRLSNAHAELILDSLKHYQLNLHNRKRIELMYADQCPPAWQLPPREIPWVFDMDLGPNIDTQAAVKELNNQGVQARCGFKPLSSQEEFLNVTKKEDHSTAYRLAKQRIYLPIDPKFNQDQVIHNMNSLIAVVDGLG